jgi:uncharacterized protein YdeI (YjbR/CyaY-like superfamily)
VQITETFYAPDRATWRRWLAQNHTLAKEIWLVTYAKGTSRPSIPYLHAVEEALCFGWIDSIAKRIDAERSVQRFTPRKPKSHWTELNKERARRLIAAGKMTEADFATLPDLSMSAFQIAPDILTALQAESQTWTHFQAFLESYKRIRVGYIEEMRHRPAEFHKRLANFLKKTRQNKMFGVME